MTIDINPIAFRLGPLAISWYGIMIVLALVTLVLLSAHQSRRVGITRDHIYNLALYAILAGIVGARLVHVVDYWSYYSANPREIFGFSGFAVYGAILGAALATGFYAWRKKLSFWALGDTVAPAAVLAQGIGRLGCTFNGCCYGRVTDVPWAFTWTDPATFAPANIPVHPAQVYLLLWNLAVFAFLWSLRTRLKPQGSLLLAYLGLYSFGDFWIRFYREGELPVGGLLQAQVIGLGVTIAAVAALYIRRYLSRPRGLEPSPVNPPEPGPEG